MLAAHPQSCYGVVFGCLDVWMTRSAAFTIACVATLSMTLYTNLKLRFVRYVTFCLKYSTIVSAFASFIGFASIAFVVQSYRMKMTITPFIDVMENLPVRSAYIVPTFLSMKPLTLFPTPNGMETGQWLHGFKMPWCWQYCSVGAAPLSHDPFEAK